MGKNRLNTPAGRRALIESFFPTQREIEQHEGEPPSSELEKRLMKVVEEELGTEEKPEGEKKG